MHEDAHLLPGAGEFHPEAAGGAVPATAGALRRQGHHVPDDQGATIQIVSRESSKRVGIEKVRKALGLCPEEIAVFGDDLNDLEMISAYPVSIAMGNAVEEVKAAAKYVTLENDAGGIAHALKNILHVI